MVRWVVLAGALLLAGCGGPQSALDPAGRGAETIARLFWWMAAGGAVIWIAVIGLAVYAFRARPGPHEKQTALDRGAGGAPLLRARRDAGPAGSGAAGKTSRGY